MDTASVSIPGPAFVKFAQGGPIGFSGHSGWRLSDPQGCQQEVGRGGRRLLDRKPEALSSEAAAAAMRTGALADTTLLVRHLIEDDAKQLRVVRRELEKAERRGSPVWIGDVTLVETFRVLQHGFRLSATAVVDVLLILSDDARFVFQSGSDLRLALERPRTKGDLPEHLISLAARRAGSEKTQTFDRAVKAFTEFEVL